MTRIRVSATTVLLALVASTLAVFAAASPASAAAPVTVADAVQLYPGNVIDVPALANDSDADGDELAICRIGNERYKGKGISFDFFPSGGENGEDLVLLFARSTAKPGTYTFTYYACDFETLVPGTITLTVVRAPKITVKPLPGRPGKIKVTNPADFKIRFLYGDADLAEPDGDIKIVKNSSVILNVRRTTIDWIALSARGFTFLREGSVRVKVRRGTAPPTTDRQVSPRIARLWQT